MADRWQIGAFLTRLSTHLSINPLTPPHPHIYTSIPPNTQLFSNRIHLAMSSNQPTNQPISQTTIHPSNQPNNHPSIQSTKQPSIHPSNQPTNQTTIHPINQPTIHPSNKKQTNKQTKNPPTYIYFMSILIGRFFLANYMSRRLNAFTEQCGGIM